MHKKNTIAKDRGATGRKVHTIQFNSIAMPCKH